MRSCVVYVAGPISHGSLTHNVEQAHEAAVLLIRAGLSVIVPHASCFYGNQTCPIAYVGSPFLPETNPHGIETEVWYQVSLELLRRSDCVLRLPGASKGADLETAEACRLGMPVFESVEECVRWASKLE